MATNPVPAHYALTVVLWDEDLLAVPQIAAAAGLHPELVRRLYCLGVLDAAEEAAGEPLFHVAAAAKLRRMARLRRDLGLQWSAAALVADLVDRIDTLEARVRELEARPAGG